MQIEAGKYYRTRDGRKVGPMKIVEPASSYQWNNEDEIHGRWDNDGEDGHGHFGPEPGDIVSEWTESPVRTVTRKEIMCGSYGRVSVDKVTSEYVHMYFNGDSILDASELRAAAATLIEIADALEDK